MSISESTPPTHANCFDQIREYLPHSKISIVIVAPLACIALIAGTILIAQGFNLPAGYALLTLGSVAFVVDTLVLVSLFYKKNSDQTSMKEKFQHESIEPQKLLTENPKTSHNLVEMINNQSSYLEQTFENQYLRATFLSFLSLQAQEKLGLTNKSLKKQIENVHLEQAKKEGFQGDDISKARNYLYNQTYIDLLKILAPVRHQELEEEVLNINTTNDEILEIRKKQIEKIPFEVQLFLSKSERISSFQSINKLVEAGARVDVFNLKDSKEKTALHLALEQNNPTAVSNLIKAGANIHATDKWGRTPFHLAAKHNRFECMELLVRHGADTNCTDLAGQTALHHAVLANHRAEDCLSVGLKEFKINKLLALGVDLNIQDNDGNAPLHLITRSKFSKLGIKWLEYLFDRMDLNAKNKRGDTPLHLAIDSIPVNIDYACCLIQKGADVQVFNNKGETPLDRVMSRKKMASSEDGSFLSALAERLLTAPLS